MSVLAQTPLIYWYRTRINKGTVLCQYTALQVGTLLIGLFYLADGFDNSRLLVCFGIFYVAMICVYEIGYIVNDFISLRREQNAGWNLDKKSNGRLTKMEWLGAVGVRVLVVSMIAVVLKVARFQVLPFVYFNLIILIVFQIHNVILYPLRIGSFFLLYLVRYLLPVFVIFSQAYIGEGLLNRVAYFFLFAGVYAFYFAISYGIQKNIITALYLKTVKPVERAVFGTIVTLLPLSFLLSAEVLWWESLFLLAYELSVTGLLFSVGVIHGYLYSKQNVSHTHTLHSHDASLDSSDYIQLLANTPIKKIFITDHAEDFDEGKYRELRGKLSQIDGVIPGLEYSINMQHVLVHDLKAFISIDAGDILESCKQLKEKSQRTIWAHPTIAVRKLFNREYVGRLMLLASQMDGFEIYNRKSAHRGKRSILEYTMVAFFGIMMFGRKSLYFGWDAHHSSDIPKFS